MTEWEPTPRSELSSLAVLAAAPGVAADVPKSWSSAKKLTDPAGAGPDDVTVAVNCTACP